jgi:hypothetical protein
MHRLTNTGTPYETYDDVAGEAIAAGMIVLLRDGRAAEVIVPPMPNGMLVARPWDACDGFYYPTDSVQPWLDFD